MFTINNVSLRPMELEDIDTLYDWFHTIEFGMWGGWHPALSHAAFRTIYEKRVKEIPTEQEMLMVEYEGQLVGFVQLAFIEQLQKRAGVGIGIGRQETRGHGVGSTALRLLLDYAFTVKGLERVYAYVYGYNQRSQRLMERTGFTKEGVLRQHELHNGVRQDVHVYGMLKDEFYQQYETIFSLAEK